MEYTQDDINEKLVRAAYSNDLELIKELLTSDKHPIKAQINKDSRFIGNICSNGDLNTLRYILTSPELKEHANIHLDGERALACAIYACDIPMVKYLLTSPELKEHANLNYVDRNGTHTNFEYIFKIRSFENSAKLVDYFTLDYAIETKNFDVYHKLLKYEDDSDYKEQMRNNFMAFFLSAENGETLVNNSSIDVQVTLMALVDEFELKSIYEKYKLKSKLDNSLEQQARTHIVKI